MIDDKKIYIINDFKLKDQRGSLETSPAWQFVFLRQFPCFQVDNDPI
jgi:hypothetical protein